MLFRATTAPPCFYKNIDSVALLFLFQRGQQHIFIIKKKREGPCVQLADAAWVCSLARAQHLLFTTIAAARAATRVRPRHIDVITI